MSRGGRRHISNALCRVLSSLNDKPNGIYILPTAPMPTEKLITYLPTYDKTILYVMITLVSINLMILLYKFLTRKLQHSTIALELSTGHRCITHPLINVPLCPKMYHYLARENFSHMKVEGWIRPMLLWERGQITIVNFLDHSELQIPQKTFVSVWQLRNQTKKNTETIGLLLCNYLTWISCESLSYDMYYIYWIGALFPWMSPQHPPIKLSKFLCIRVYQTLK